MRCVRSSEYFRVFPLRETSMYSFDELMEPAFVVLREYLADGLERPFLVRGGEKVLGD